MTNKTLGGYDMMFSISMNKINAMLKNLIDLEVIPDKMRFLTEKDGVRKCHDVDAFEEEFQNWLSRYDPELIEQKRILLEFLSIERAKVPRDKVRISELQDELYELEEKLGVKSDQADYDIACDAEIESYSVAVIPENNNLLQFSIKISEGFIWTKKFDPKLNVQLLEKEKIDSCRYTFMVRISERIIKSDEMILTDEEELKNVVSGIDANLFKIESLFMDFQNSNLMTYDPIQSYFPPSATKRSMQLVFLEFFDQISKTDNPFVLGYRVVPKTLSRIADFTPTAIKYTCSHDTQAKLQSFNYMMQIANKSLPQKDIEGMFVKSLLLHNQEQKGERDGVFAINFEEFRAKQIDSLSGILIDQIENMFRQTMEGFHVTKNGLRIDCNQHNHHVDLSIFYVGARNETQHGRNGVSFVWGIEINGNYHIEHKLNDFINKIIDSSIGINFPYSSNPDRGRFKMDSQNERGQHGNITLFMYPINDGKIQFNFKMNQPVLGYIEQNGAQFENPKDMFAFNLLNLGSPYGVLMGAINAIENKQELHIDIKTRIVTELDLDNLDAFSNRVILPGSNVLAFKSIRLLNGKQDDQDALLFDVTYADTNE